jgi:hypothetical protein
MVSPDTQNTTEYKTLMRVVQLNICCIRGHWLAQLSVRHN